MDFLSRIKRLIRYVKVTGPADNSENYPIQQITYNGKAARAYVIMPYGMYANASSSDVLGVCFTVNAADSNKAFIPTIPNKRPIDLEQNEVAVYHPYTEAFIKFRNNGDIEVDVKQQTQGNVIVNAKVVTINADLKVNGTLDVTGNCDLGSDGGTQITMNGTDASKQVLTTGSINPLTGTPYPSGNPNIRGDA